MNWLGASLLRQMIAVVTLGALLLLVLVFVNKQVVDREIQDLQQTLSQEVAASQEVMDLLVDFQSQVEEWKNLLLRGHDPADLDRYWRGFKAQESVITEQFANLQGYDLASEYRRQIDQLARQYPQLVARYSQAEALMRRTGDARQVDASVRGIDNEFGDQLDQLAERLRVEARNQLAQDLLELEQDTRLLNIAMILAVIAFASGLAVFLHRLIIKPTLTLVQGVERLSVGDLSQPLQMSRLDELGLLSKSTQTLHAFLLKMVQQLRDTTAKTRTVMDDIGHTQQQVVHSSESARANITQVATATEQMSASANEVASHASQAAEFSAEVNQAVSLGQGNVQQASKGMNNLLANMSTSMDKMSDLEEETAKIGSVLDVIKAIAEQTNLLALNAAIEAARAGDQGRGFAVVADEVRSLAKRTQESTAEIESMISRLQQASRSVVDSMSGAQTLSASTEQSFGSAEQGLQQISHKMTDLDAINTQVATAAQQQASVASDIANNLTDAVQQIQHSVSEIQQLQALIQRVEQQAQASEELGVRFKL